MENLIPALMALPVEVYLLVVDDNSPDGTAQLVREMSEKEPRLHLLLRDKKEGYGPAMIAGFKKSLELGASHVVTMDADFSHDPNDVPRLLKALEDCEIALGSRYAKGIRVLNWAPRRLLLSMAANNYVRKILGLEPHDCTSGFRGYRREALENGILDRCRFQGYSFLVEMLYRLTKEGRSVCEVEIIYTERREGQSKMSKKVIFEAAFAPWILRVAARRSRKR